jgi:hypothetical protein
MTNVFARNILLNNAGIEFENLSRYLNGDARSQAEGREIGRIKCTTTYQNCLLTCTDDLSIRNIT